jgi:peptidoglycan/LPS O-acetylase OafA/YrhL
MKVSNLNESTNLDFLRSIAVLSVFATHYYDIRTGAGAMWSIPWHLGQLGVMIFFVHTCLVLMWSLERTSAEGQRLFTPFYARRIFRIYPLSMTCVLFAYFFDAQWSPVNFFQNLTLTQYVLFHSHKVLVPPTVTPLWTLPLEIEMYVALPMLFLLLRNRPVKLLVAIWGASIAAAYILSPLGDVTGASTIFKYVPCFLGGVMAWRLTRERYYRPLPAWLWPVAIAAVSCVWMRASERYLPLFIAALGMSLGLAIPLFREIQSKVVRRASQLVARYSYGIYLSHFPIMLYVMNSDKHHWFKIIPPMPVIPHYGGPIHALLVVIFTCAASLVLYHGIEEPGIRLGRRVAHWLTDIRADQQGLDVELVKRAIWPNQSVF